MSKQEELISVRMPDGTIVNNVPAGTSQAEVLRRYQLTQTPPAEKQPEPGFMESMKRMVSGNPNVQFVQEAGRKLGRMGLGAVQYGQYMTGSKITPTPTSLEPVPSPTLAQRAGSIAGEILPTAAVPSAGLTGLAAQSVVGAASGAMAEQSMGGSGQVGGMIGAVTPGALNATGRVIGAAARKAAPTINHWIQVASKEMEAGADPGARLIKENLVKLTKTKTKEAIQPVLNKVGKELGSKLSDATAKGIKIDADNIIMDAITNSTKTIGVGSDPAFQARLDVVLSDILKQAPNPSNLTPVEAHELKKAVGDAIKWHGAAFEGDINQVLVDIYRGLNKTIKTKIPGIDAVQSRWSDLYLAHKSIIDSITKDRAGTGTGNFSPLVKKGAKAAAEAAGAGLALDYVRRRFK